MIFPLLETGILIDLVNLFQILISSVSFGLKGGKEGEGRRGREGGKEGEGRREGRRIMECLTYDTWYMYGRNIYIESAG